MPPLKIMPIVLVSCMLWPRSAIRSILIPKGLNAWGAHSLQANDFNNNSGTLHSKRKAERACAPIKNKNCYMKVPCTPFASPFRVTFTSQGYFEPNKRCRTSAPQDGLASNSSDHSNSYIVNNHKEARKPLSFQEPSPKRARRLPLIPPCKGLCPKVGWTIEQYCELCHG